MEWPACIPILKYREEIVLHNEDVTLPGIL
jgi:hypothetical protein